MFSGISFFILPQKIGDVQLNLLKKCVAQQAGILQTSFDSNTDKIVTGLSTFGDVVQALLPQSIPQHTLVHTTEWISKSLIRGSKCNDDQYRLFEILKNSPNKTQSNNDFHSSHAGKHSIANINAENSGPLDLKSSVHPLNDPAFGLKHRTKRKRSIENESTPPDSDIGSIVTRDETDHFGKHMIRKRAKFDEFDQITSTHKISSSYSGNRNGLSSKTVSELIPLPNTPSSLNLVYPPSDEEEPIAISNSTELRFAGEALPRQLTGARASQFDDLDDPRFYSLLKPPPPNTDIDDDSIKYQGPWADKFKQSQENVSQMLLSADEDSQDSADEDFAGSQVFFNDDDYKKNFGPLSQKPLSKYLERQKKSLACQKPPLSSPEGKALTEARNSHPNKHITDQLEKLEAICLGSGDQWRGYAYRKAANMLKNLKYPVETTEQALKLRGIGKSIAEKIGEIVSTGKLRKLDALQNEGRIQILSLFMGIFGVGMATANKWHALGYKTLEDVQKNAVLTYSQAIGLKYYYEFQERIPRSEMELICSGIKSVINKIDPDYIVEICGSYRRGKADCGDIDIIITHKKPSALKTILLQAVPKLHEAGILTHDFVHIAEMSDKYMGVCQASPEGLHRRIDMLTVLPQEWPFALLYFTGSGHFNRSMRFWAGKRGYSLSQHGLRVNYGNDNKGPYIAGIQTEKQIFEALGLEYRPPEDRDV